jgi:hypothetical protein
MLKLTALLIDEARSASPHGIAPAVVMGARVRLIAQHGGLEDADALLRFFLEAPTDYRRESVLEAVMRLGNLDTAQALATACLDGHHLKDGVCDDVLRALGYLGYEEARDVLWNCAQNGSWTQHCEASLGLLNLSCVGLERDISDAIRACIGRNLFPEFLPILAHKTGDSDLPELLFGMGESTASSDCNGGLVYGIALYGEIGAPYFDRLIFSPQWEAWGPGTGTGAWTYEGYRHLNRRLVELALAIRRNHASVPFDQWECQLQTWVALADRFLSDPFPVVRGAPHPSESATDIYHAAFGWSSPDRDDSLIGLTQSDGWVSSERVRALAVRLADRLSYEVLRDETPLCERGSA